MDLRFADHLGVARQSVVQLAEQDGLPRPRTMAGGRLWNGGRTPLVGDPSLAGSVLAEVGKVDPWATL